MSGASIVASGTLSAPGQSAAISPKATVDGGGALNVTLSGTWTGSVNIERSFDNGTTWNIVSEDGTGTAATYTANMSVECVEGERGVSYRINATSVGSGTVVYRLSQ